MPLLRHHAVLLEQVELVTTPLLGKIFRIRPSDGDGVADRDQSWQLFVDLASEGAGAVSVELWTSYDARSWARAGRVQSRAGPVVSFGALGPLGPLVQLRTALTPRPDQPALSHRVTARLASDAPFQLVPSAG